MTKLFISKLTLWVLVGTSTFALGIISMRLRTAAPHEAVLLEVSARDWGMVCTNENYLELRVYDTGRTEGDVFSGSCNVVFIRFLSSFKRKTSQLKPNQLAELKAVLSEEELSTLKNSYPQFAIYVDSGTNQSISFEHEGKRQKVELINPDPTDRRNVANYPASLIKLLVEAQKIRQQLEEPLR